MAVLALFPARVSIGHALVNGQKTEVFASPALLNAFRTLFERVGGAIGPSNTDLAVSDDDDSGLEEFKAETWKALDALGMQPLAAFEPFLDPMHPLPYEHAAVGVEALQTELAGLREEVAVLRTLINDIQQGTAL